MEKQHGHGDNKQFFFFFNDQKIEAEQSELTGRQIKELIAQNVPNFDASHVLVSEGHGNHPDEPVADDESVSLRLGHGEGHKRFFTRPPADFGA